MSEKSTTQNKVQVYEIPEEGSLGLLALGYRGLQLWRKKILNIEESDERIIGPIIARKIASDTKEDK